MNGFTLTFSQKPRMRGKSYHHHIYLPSRTGLYIQTHTKKHTHGAKSHVLILVLLEKGPEFGHLVFQGTAPQAQRGDLPFKLSDLGVQFVDLVGVILCIVFVLTNSARKKRTEMKLFAVGNKSSKG